jgi:hypothetical protein
MTNYDHTKYLILQTTVNVQICEVNHGWKTHKKKKQRQTICNYTSHPPWMITEFPSHYTVHHKTTHMPRTKNIS